MTLTVTGIETIEITDPQGLIDAQKAGPPLPEAVKRRRDDLDMTRLPPKPTINQPAPLFPPPFRPGVGDPVINPIPLPGHLVPPPFPEWTSLPGEVGQGSPGDLWGERPG